MGLRSAIIFRLKRLPAIVCGAAAGLIMLAGGPALAGPDPTPLHFGLIGSMSPQELESRWTPLLADMARSIGAPVSAENASDYAGMVWALRSGKVQLAWFGNKSAIQAVDHARGEVFAKLTDPNGLAGYYSLLVVPVKSPINSAQDMLLSAGKLTLALGDPNSTSGYVVPMAHLFGPDQNPERLFKRVLRGNHEANFLAVAEGRADVGVMSSTTLEQLTANHPREASSLRIIWRSPLIPSDPLVWRKDLPDDTKQAIRAFFLSYGQPAPGKSAQKLAHERDVLRALSVGSFSLTDDRHLLPVRKMELFAQRLRVESDTTLSPEEKARRLATLEHDLFNLNNGLSAQVSE